MATIQQIFVRGPTGQIKMYGEESFLFRLLMLCYHFACSPIVALRVPIRGQAAEFSRLWAISCCLQRGCALRLKPYTVNPEVLIEILSMRCFASKRRNEVHRFNTQPLQVTPFYVVSADPVSV
jgi:hypothetical protein